MLEAQFRSGPTVMGLRKFERTRKRLTIRKIGNGQSLQCLRKKKTNGRHASKNATQLETMIRSDLAKSFSSGMEPVVLQCRCPRKNFRESFRFPTFHRILSRLRYFHDGCAHCV